MSTLGTFRATDVPACPGTGRTRCSCSRDSRDLALTLAIRGSDQWPSFNLSRTVARIIVAPCRPTPSSKPSTVGDSSAHRSAPAIDELLAELTSADTVPEGNDVTGAVTLGEEVTRVSRARSDASADAGGLPADYPDPAAHSFRFWLVLNSAPPRAGSSSSPPAPRASSSRPPTYQPSNDESTWCPRPAMSASAASPFATSHRRHGGPGRDASSLTDRWSSPPALSQLQLVPPTVLIGSSGFGLTRRTGWQPGGFVIDDCERGRTRRHHDHQWHTSSRRKADYPAWRGLAVRHARFYLPSGVPVSRRARGRRLRRGRLGAGRGHRSRDRDEGAADGPRPGFDVLIECRDPAATGLQDFIPTLVEAAMTLPLDGMHQAAPAGGFTMLAGKPVIARLRFARTSPIPRRASPSPSSRKARTASSRSSRPRAAPRPRVLITAAALATAIVADKAPEGADTGGVVLHALLAVALGLSSCLKDKGQPDDSQGRVVEHRPRPPGRRPGEVVDRLLGRRRSFARSTSACCRCRWRDEQPMRVRNRNVGLRIDLRTQRRAVSRPSTRLQPRPTWRSRIPVRGSVNSPASLFDILGTRSGRGSTWQQYETEPKRLHSGRRLFPDLPVHPDATRLPRHQPRGTGRGILRSSVGARPGSSAHSSAAADSAHSLFQFAEDRRQASTAARRLSASRR